MCGYWSLLILEALMNEIAQEEEICVEDEEDDFDGLHSFWPEQWPSNVSHRPYDPDEEARLEEVSSDDRAAICRALNPSRRFLPCHYFDYIFRSSSGG